jgi:hypothetical protein
MNAVAMAEIVLTSDNVGNLGESLRQVPLTAKIAVVTFTWPFRSCSCHACDVWGEGGAILRTFGD